MIISRGANSQNENCPVSVDDRMVSLLRLLISLAALLIIFVDSSEPDRFVEITYTVLILYCVYSAVIYLTTVKGFVLIPVQSVHWIDIFWYSILISLSSGTNSIFFYFYFFSILVAAFRWGFKTGFSVVAVSTVLFTLVGIFISQTGQAIEINRFLIQIVCLLALGYMVSFWGGREVTLRKRLSLLRDINRLSNPRFGVDHTLFSIMQKLRSFYNADSCLLILKSSISNDYLWREVSRDGENDSNSGERTAAVNPLLTLAGDYSIFYRSRQKTLLKIPDFNIHDSTDDRQNSCPKENFAALSDLIEAESFISVPLHQNGELTGRIYLTGQKKVFDRSDMDFIRQLVEQVLPVIENIQLLDLLASEAVEQYNRRISRDIHDSTIQPYIGLKLGLEALEIKSTAGRSVRRDIRKLINLADSTIADLRGFVGKLKGDDSQFGNDVLVSALHRQTDKFQQFYGLKVHINSDSNIHINDRLAAEVFQMVMEGLSNVRRHTKSKTASVNIRREPEELCVEIDNKSDNGHFSKMFLPESIAGRAASLGGTVVIEQIENITRVSVAIPL